MSQHETADAPNLYPQTSDASNKLWPHPLDGLLEPGAARYDATVSIAISDLVPRLRGRARSARSENTGTGLGDALHFEQAANRIDMLVAALRACLNYIENTEGEFGIKLTCGDMARAALQQGSDK